MFPSIGKDWPLTDPYIVIGALSIFLRHTALVSVQIILFKVKANNVYPYNMNTFPVNVQKDFYRQLRILSQR